MTHTVTAETSALVKAVGILVGECLFGLFGPLMFIPLLSWFEIGLPVAVMVGVVCGACVGFVLADGGLHLYRRGLGTGRATREVVIGERAGAHL